ncbi:hypothetical protein DNU06_03975 [Putridiphycobacter roseus]|uniref:AI-2E family transporter n=1 Tax=Putridiphycobacter roseus TaxID=2219161 RepID=A0A2W1NED5_9FLAO|nr:AI-2E family transporter [Putridiphycobacter roseus]PZE17785.1 hypothetical protein DNU06_03975 [Putridiphycobacter roseus]
MMTKRLYRTLIITSIIVLTIYYAGNVLMPLIFSGFCAMFVHPLVKRFESIGLPLVASSLIVVLLLVIVVGTIISLFIYEGTGIIQELPMFGVQEVMENPVDAIDKKVAINLESYREHIFSAVASFKEKVIAIIPETIININNAIIFMVSCPIYIFFMLISRSSIRKFYYTSFENKRQHMGNEILNEIEHVYIQYLKGLSYVMMIVATLTSIGLLALGIDYAIFIGILAGLLTLVPYVGVIISAAIPVAIAVLTKDSLWYALGVVGIFAVVQFLEGNFITPKIMGGQVEVNPLMVIVGIVIFGAIGGIVGMILTIPILALLKIIAKYVPGWKPLENLLSV